MGRLALGRTEEPWLTGGTNTVNDDRPVEESVEGTTAVDRVVVHVHDDEPELSDPGVLPVPDCEDDTELELAGGGGHNVISEADAVWDMDEPVVVGVIVRVCTPGEA